MRKTKFNSILLSVAVAFGLWLYVVSTVSQQDDRTYYNVPVVLEGESKLSERNLMITYQSAKAVSLHLSGSRGDLNKLSPGSNLVARADLSSISEPGESIPLNYAPVYATDVSSSDITVESRSPAQIFVNVDYRRTKEIPVQIKWTGTRSENYIYDTENVQLDNPMITISGPASVADRIYRRTKEIPVQIKWTGTRSENYIYDTENVQLDNPMITISGPASVADRIDHAEIEIDLSEQVESISQSYRYTLCDESGEPVDAEQILTSAEAVRVDMQIQRPSTVPMFF